MEKLPPIEKVYEAWSAVADRRVELHPDERGLDADRSRSVGAGSLRRAGRARHSRQTRVGQTAEVLEGVRENSDRARARQPMRPRFYVSAR